VADALHRRYGDAPGPVSGRIAGHLAAAGATGPAVDWYARAADAAQSLYAHADAVRLLDRALDLLRAQPATRERDTRELALLTTLAAPLSVVESFASPRLDELQERAGRTC
jgi:hypothetical protein